MPANSLAEADCLYLLDHFFMANAETMIRPFPRYYELYLRRALGRNASAAARRAELQNHYVALVGVAGCCLRGSRQSNLVQARLNSSREVSITPRAAPNSSSTSA